MPSHLLCMTILTWIAFNLADGIRVAVNRGDTVRNIAKIFLSIFFVFVGFFFLNVSFIGGSILGGYATALLEVESTAGDRLSALSTSPGSIGSTLQILFHVFIVMFQLTLI